MWPIGTWSSKSEAPPFRRRRRDRAGPHAFRMSKTLLISLFALVLFATARAARDDERISQLKEEIHTIEAMASDDTADKPRLQQRLGVLQQELMILETRQGLENKERGLQAAVYTTPLGKLKDRLHGIAADTAALEGRQRELIATKAAVAAERDQLLREAAELKVDPASSPRRAEIEERTFTKNEQLRSLSLQE